MHSLRSSLQTENFLSLGCNDLVCFFFFPLAKMCQGESRPGQARSKRPGLWCSDCLNDDIGPTFSVHYISYSRKLFGGRQGLHVYDDICAEVMGECQPLCSVSCDNHVRAT